MNPTGMTHTVEFFYDYGSPASYIAWAQLPALCERYGATLVRRPLLLGGVFKATGNASPAMVQAKGRWMFEDLTRHARAAGIPFRMNPHFMLNTLAAMRGAVWAQQAGVLPRYDQALFEATWAHQRNVSDPAELRHVLAEAGLDAAACAAGVQDDAVKKGLIANTEEAVSRGVFGAPTMFVAGQMHFGQDRLDWVERALKG
jgi:2-hydroxychromene-2-carboxylate isomerase